MSCLLNVVCLFSERLAAICLLKVELFLEPKSEICKYMQRENTAPFAPTKRKLCSKCPIMENIAIILV